MPVVTPEPHVVAVAALAAREDAPSTSVHLPTDLADAFLREHGWTIIPAGGFANVYVKPGRRAKSDGGRFGEDWLWERDEALTVAIVAAALPGLAS